MVSTYWTYYDHDEKYEQDVKKECDGAAVKAGLSLTNSVVENEGKLSDKLDKWLVDIMENNVQ